MKHLNKIVACSLIMLSQISTAAGTLNMFIGNASNQNVLVYETTQSPNSTSLPANSLLHFNNHSKVPELVVLASSSTTAINCPTSGYPLDSGKIDGTVYWLIDANNTCSAVSQEKFNKFCSISTNKCTAH